MVHGLQTSRETLWVDRSSAFAYDQKIPPSITPKFHLHIEYSSPKKPLNNRIWTTLYNWSESIFNIFKVIFVYFYQKLAPHKEILNDDLPKELDTSTTLKKIVETDEILDEFNEVNDAEINPIICNKIVFENDIFQIFNQPISDSSYKKFRYQILTKLHNESVFDRPLKRSSVPLLSLPKIDPKEKIPEQLFNNYSVDSYLQLKDQYKTITSDEFKRCKNAYTRHQLASMAAYDVIVNLYVRRFLNKNPSMENESYLGALHFTALCIACKIACDFHLWNEDFCSYLGDASISLKTHKMMEMKFLNEIKWNTSIKELSL